MSDAWVTEFVGLPYKILGRDKNDGLDCWGLVHLVLKEHFGKELPSFEAIGFDKDHNIAVTGELIRNNMPLVSATKTEELEQGTLVLMNLARQPCHIGIAVSPFEILHIERKKNSVVDRISRLKSRIVGYYNVS